MTSSMPDSTASSTRYCTTGRSTMGISSLGRFLVAGRKRVPKPATAMTAFLIVTIILSSGARSEKSSGPLSKIMAYDHPLTQQIVFRDVGRPPDVPKNDLLCERVVVCHNLGERSRRLFRTGARGKDDRDNQESRHRRCRFWHALPARDQEPAQGADAHRRPAGRAVPR